MTADLSQTAPAARAPKRKRKRAKANRLYFTEENVLVLRPERKQYLVWDADIKRGDPNRSRAVRGLAILVSPTGTKSYRCKYYYPGSAKLYYKHLGRVGVMTLAEARDETIEAKRRASQGEDPNADAPLKSDTFQAAVEQYIDDEQIGNHENKSAKATQTFMLYQCRDWHGRPIATIRHSEIRKLLNQVRDGDEDKGLKPRPPTANRLYSHLKDFFAWCVRVPKTIKASPMIGIDLPASAAARKSRERDWFKKQAGDNAIKQLWRCADEIGGNEGRYLKLMILTGKRKTALASMRWDEIDQTWFWDPPPSKVANKRLHGVPLPELAQRILHPRQSEGLVFGTLALDPLQRTIRQQSGMPDFFWHGLRHLAETKTAELRDANGHSLILPHVRDMLFDHVPQRGSGSRYDHHDYIPEMRSAMETWAEYIHRLIEPAEGVKRLR